MLGGDNCKCTVHYLSCKHQIEISCALLLQNKLSLYTDPKDVPDWLIPKFPKLDSSIGKVSCIVPKASRLASFTAHPLSLFEHCTDHESGGVKIAEHKSLDQLRQRQLTIEFAKLSIHYADCNKEILNQHTNAKS